MSSPKEICEAWVRHQRSEVTDQAEIERLALEFWNSGSDGGLSHVIAAERELLIASGVPVVRWHSFPGALPPMTLDERDALNPKWGDMVNIDNRELQTWTGEWQLVERKPAPATEPTT